MTATRAHLSSRARAAVFAPLEPTGRAETVARRLSDAIAVGLLRDEEQLPSEPDLADRFGVATVTVREALTTLRRQGLVRTRRGRGGGSFVCAPSDPWERSLRSRLRTWGLGELRDVADHYAALSGASARLAAERADAEDVGRLRAAAAALTGAVSAGERRRAEGRFHIELAASAQSPRLTRAEIALQTEVGAVLWLPHGDAAAVREAAAHHDVLVDAVSSQDPALARSSAEEHVRDLFARVRELHNQAMTTP